MGFFRDRLSHFVLVVFLRFFIGGIEVLVSILVDQLTPIMDQVQVNGLIGFNLVLVLIRLVLVVPLVEHLRHGLVVDVGDELGLELLLHPLNQALIFKQVTLRQIVGLLDLV